MSSAEEELRQQVRELEERFLSLAEAEKDIVVIVQDGAIVFVNSAVTGVFGYGPEDLIGRQFVELLFPEDREPLSKSYNEIQSGARQPQAGEFKVRDKDGQVKHLQGSGVIIQFRGKPGLMSVVRDVTDRKRIEEALRQAEGRGEESEQRFKAIFDNATDGILLASGEKRKFDAGNAMICRMLGYTPEEIVNLGVDDIHTEEDLPFVREQFDKQMRGEITLATDIPMKRKDGSVFFADVNAAPIQLHGKTYLMGIFRDVTDRKKVEEGLRQASRAKDEFLANMGHELRTPLNGIIGMTSLLQDTEMTLQQRQYVRTVSRSARALLTIINDLLDSSSIETGRMSIEPAPFDLKSAVDDVIQVLTTRALEKGLELTALYSPDAPRRVVGDAGRIRQVLTNLVDNAIKFTDEGRVVVTVECVGKPTKLSDDHARLRLSVEDTGMGIPEGGLERIFDKFTQVDATPARRHGGTGLGLAISKQLVELMGGNLGVNSRPGEGSNFWFILSLPMQADAAALEGEMEAISSRVLVVEDNDVNQEVAATILRKLGCVVEVAGNGKQAVKMAEITSYDLIFMDCQMPGMDGFEATAEIRRYEEASGHHTKIVAMTAHTTDEDRDRCLTSGMDDYIGKPATYEDFQKVLQRLRP
jgi:PAS domain S-box-containing protein